MGPAKYACCGASVVLLDGAIREVSTLIFPRRAGRAAQHARVPAVSMRLQQCPDCAGVTLLDERGAQSGNVLTVGRLRILCTL